MYLVGAPHPHKADAQRLLENLISDRQRLVTDAEVLQEILMEQHGIKRILSFDSGLDGFPGITRLS